MAWIRPTSMAAKHDLQGDRMRILVALLILFAGQPLHAQQLSLPHWMLQALGMEPDSTEPSAHTDTNMLRFPYSNQFIGTWTMTSTITGFPGGNATFTCWSDTTKAILQVAYAGQGMGRHVFMADLRANVAIKASEQLTAPTALILDWRSAVADRYNSELLRSPSYFLPATGERTILGQRCADHPVPSQDTLHYWIAETGPSPFTDIIRWVPDDPFLTGAHEMAIPFEGTVLLRSNSTQRAEVTQLVQGTQPQPVLDLADHVLQDLRKRASGETRTTPARREWMVPKTPWHSSVEEWPEDIRVVQRPNGIDSLVDECGAVTVMTKVSRDGTVKGVRILQPEDEPASQAVQARALRFAKEFRYEPMPTGPRRRDAHLTFIFRSKTDPDCGLIDRMIRQKKSK